MKEEKLFETMADINENYVVEAHKKPDKKKQNLWLKWVAATVCLCITAVGVTALISKGDLNKSSAIKGQGSEPIPGGNSEVMYSVAVLPADRDPDDIQNAYCKDIGQAEVQNEAGLCDYLPSVLPNGYHFDCASIYVTTMKDSTVYKMLRVTYSTKAPAGGDGSATVQSNGEQNDEFRISVFDFKPDTSRDIYDAEKVREESANGKLGNGLFYVQYGNYYVGIAPLALNSEEIIDLMDNING